MTLAEFHARIVESVPDMPRQVALAARYVVDHPDDVPLISMRDLAARAGVSPATLLRFSQALGFNGWADLRALHVSHLRQTPVPYTERATRALSCDGVEALVAESFKAYRANLDHTEWANPPEVFARAAAHLVRAERVFISAFMSCRGPGMSFAYLCRMLRNNVTLLGAEATALGVDLALLRPSDAVLSINFDPYGHEIDQIARAIETRGATLICLSDSRLTSLTPLAAETLIFPVDGPSFFPSIVAAQALVEALIAAVLTELGPEATARIGQIERALYDSGTYASLNKRDA
ncbi:MurR/RpiR family transcriptional regulator [Roseovarius sp. ZX-A-9]|uniref:MurR/RpiR family transcriptional regulator n=1 Tax=Roseovarius sp. ZX-A-9 TaxID=3014783 RepID=UPI00232F65F0|nr:MurR/RpiR family transcriptional regulator [Roseovarius sp. ZX-A-9]